MRVLLSFVIALCVWTGYTRPAQAAVPNISAPEAIVVDGWSGAILYNRNADVPRYPASTVKIMTALLVLQHLPLNRIVTVSSYAASFGGSTAGLWAGERISVWNLLHGMMLPSGNDAAIALSEAVGGTEWRFVTLMNDEAIRLGLTHTHYLSPNGFDTPGQVTTAHDLALVARIAMQQKYFRGVVSSKTWVVRAANGAILHSWTNLNQLLSTVPGVNGVKTGTTPGAGACLVSSERRGGRWVIEVNMGSSEWTRFPDGTALLKYGMTVAKSVPSTR